MKKFKLTNLANLTDHPVIDALITGVIVVMAFIAAYWLMDMAIMQGYN